MAVRLPSSQVMSSLSEAQLGTETYKTGFRGAIVAAHLRSCVVLDAI